MPAAACATVLFGLLYTRGQPSRARRAAEKGGVESITLVTPVTRALSKAVSKLQLQWLRVHVAQRVRRDGAGDPVFAYG